MSKEYQKRAAFQRRLLLGLACWNAVASTALIVNIIHHW